MKDVCASLLLYLLFLTSHSNSSCQDKVNPALGDLCLETAKDNLVLIYYTDGIQPERWGTICDDLATSSTYNVMCRQLGHVFGKKKNKSSTTSSPIKPLLTDVACDNSTLNILRCSPKIKTDGECVTQQIHLQCDHGVWNQPPTDPYNGQVMLLHPSSTPTQDHQVSFGLVLIYIVGKKDGEWGPIYQDKKHQFTRIAADSVCRQMGYTEADPNYISTVQSSNTTYSGIGSNNAWLITNATMDCTASSMSCFSCCFNIPTERCSDEDCPGIDNVVLQCFFDPHLKSLPSNGSKESCQILKNQKPSFCTSPSFSYRILSYAMSGVASLLLVVLVLINVIVVYFYVRYTRRRRDPERQPILNNLDERQN